MALPVSASAEGAILTPPRALVGNIDDPQQVREGQRKDRDNDRQATDDLRAVLATVEGRRFLWRLIGHCNVFHVPYDNDRRAFNDGMRNVGLMLMDASQAADLGGFLLMQKESYEQQAKTNARNSSRANRTSQQPDRNPHVLDADIDETGG